MELHLVIEGRRDLAAQIHRQLREATAMDRLAQLPVDLRREIAPAFDDQVQLHDT